MSASDDAYRAAEAAIAEAKREGERRLSFDGEAFHALDRLPPEIAELTGLQSLYLDNTQVSDLAPLAALTGLQSLGLKYTQVSDLAPLAALTGLQSLGLKYTQVSDLAPLANLTGLQSLNLTDTQVSDLSPLAALTRLQHLYLTDTQVSDLSPLAALTRLQYLFLANTQVSDLSPLAALTGLQSLQLENTLVSDLSPLASLTGLRFLHLDNTKVSDLSPLAALTGFMRLDLDNTQVRDLRPLRGLTELAGSNSLTGISFDGIPACADPQIASIAAQLYGNERAHALLALLDAGWEPPENTKPVAFDPDPLLQSLLIDGQLEIAPDPPTEEERRDRIKQALHDRLKAKSSALAAAAGNQFPLLNRRARAVYELLDRDFAELDILSLHLEIEDLDERRETGVEDSQPYSEEVRQAISDVTRAGPGLTVDHPSVELLLERRRKARDEVMPEAEEAAHKRLSQAVIDDAAANGPNSRAMEELLQRVADQAASRALQKAKHKNLIWAIATGAGTLTIGLGHDMASSLLTEALGPVVKDFVVRNYGLLSEVAATFGKGVLVWFQQSVGPLIAGLDTTVIRPLDRPKK